MNPWRGLKGLPADAWIISAATLVNRSGTMVLIFLVLYLTGSLGFAPEVAALGVTIYGIGAIVAGPITGALCDRFGSRAVMQWSLISSGIALALVPLARGVTAVFAALFVWSLLAEAFRPACMAAITEVAGPGQSRAGIALVRLAINVGMSIGPAVGGLLATVSFTALFLADAATSVAAGILLLLWRPHAVATVGEDASSTPYVSRWQALADRRLIWFLAAFTPVLMVFFQHEAATALYLVRDLGYSESFYGLLFTINTGIIILLEVPLNLSMSHWQHRAALALGAALVALGFGALAGAASLPAIIGTVVIWTFGEMILLPGSGAYVADIAPAGRRGQYMGFYTMTFGVAFAVGPWLGTLVLERAGARALWLGCLAAGAVSTLMLMRLPRGGISQSA